MGLYSFDRCYAKDLPKVGIITEEFGFSSLSQEGYNRKWLFRDDQKTIFLRYLPNERWPLVLNIESEKPAAELSEILEERKTLTEMIQKIIIATGSRAYDEISAMIGEYRGFRGFN